MRRTEIISETMATGTQTAEAKGRKEQVIKSKKGSDSILRCGIPCGQRTAYDSVCIRCRNRCDHTAA